MSFDGDGTVELAMPGFALRVGAVLAGADGSALVAGSRSASGQDPQDREIFLVRVSGAGELDRAFGQGGVALAPPPHQSGHPIGVQTDGDGRIVVASNQVALRRDIGRVILNRFRPSGAVDETFGAGGSVTQTLGQPEVGFGASARALRRDAQGRLLIAGAFSDSRQTRMLVARLLADGSLDSTFGSGDGVTIVDVVRKAPIDVAVDIDEDIAGRAVVAGFAGRGEGRPGERFALARLTATGKLDPTFGVRGRTVTTFRVSARATDLLLQADSRIVVAGIRNLPIPAPPKTRQRVLLARYLGGNDRQPPEISFLRICRPERSALRISAEDASPLREVRVVLSGRKPLTSQRAVKLIGLPRNGVRAIRITATDVAANRTTRIVRDRGCPS